MKMSTLLASCWYHSKLVVIHVIIAQLFHSGGLSHNLSQNFKVLLVQITVLFPWFLCVIILCLSSSVTAHPKDLGVVTLCFSTLIWYQHQTTAILQFFLLNFVLLSVLKNVLYIGDMQPLDGSLDYRFTKYEYFSQGMDNTFCMYFNVFIQQSLGRECTEWNKFCGYVHLNYSCIWSCR